MTPSPPSEWDALLRALEEWISGMERGLRAGADELPEPPRPAQPGSGPTSDQLAALGALHERLVIVARGVRGQRDEAGRALQQLRHQRTAARNYVA